MLQLSPDLSFHYEALRVLAATATQGSDVSEILQVCQKLIPGDFESWYKEFYKLAGDVLRIAEECPNKKNFDNVSLRNIYLRASHYYFAADFYLHSNHDDPRINDCYQKWTSLFDKAMALLPVPGKRLSLPADGFQVPVYLLRPSNTSEPRPTIILGNGFDGALEEMIHVLGFPALERGYNVILYEGPGQTGIRRTQNVHFIHDWEKAVTPVVDWLQTLDFVDKKRISLLGYSLGGYLACRAAAFEHRLSACILLDGIWDQGLAFTDFYPESMKLLETGDVKLCNETFKKESAKSTTSRWMYDHFLWAFNESAYEGLLELKKMKVEHIIHQIKCPVFVGEARQDQFFHEQPQTVNKALGDRAYFFSPGEDTAAMTHCHVGATFFLSQEVFAWLHDKTLA